MKKWAEIYAKRGWHVFPVAERSKLPACQHGFKDATTDTEQIAALWAGRENLNLGIATGEKSGFFVLDIDGEKGEQSLKELCASNGELPQTLASTTGKGRHYLFKHVPGIKSNASKIAPGIDTRSDGGYIVAPPSIHPNGSAYQFINPLEDIADAPDWLIKLLLADTTAAKRPAQLGIVQAVAPRGRLQLSDWTPDQIEKLLSHISPDCEYDQWVNIGMAVKDAGLPFAIWDSWSSRGVKYQRAEMAHKWNSFKGSGVTLGSLVYLAKQAGWKPDNRPDYISGMKKTGPAPAPEPAQAAEEWPQEDFDPVTGEIILKTETQTQDVVSCKSQELNLVETPQAKPRTITYIAAKDIQPALEANDIVKGVIGAGQLSVIYGESNCGKTFFATDLAFHIALGQTWRDCRTEQGCVVYVALEGSHGLRNRIAAFRKDKMILGGFPFIVVPSHINMLDAKGNIDEFIEVLAEIAEQYGKVSLVVIDTLSRAFAGGDENTSQDMSAVIYHADRIRAATEAHVCFVHHSGKDKAKGARGHSSLRAAVDTEIEISRDDGANFSTIKYAKQRDIEIGEDMHFTLRKVTLGENQYGEEVTSCVVEPVERGESSHKSDGSALTASEQFVYESILNALAAVGEVRGTGSGGTHKTITYAQLYEDMLSRGFKDVLPDSDTLTDIQATEAIKKATNSARLGLRKKGKALSNKYHIWMN